MKIIYHHRIGSKDGQYVHIEELVNALRDLGHEVILVGPRAVNQCDFGGQASLVAGVRRWLPNFASELLELGYSLIDYRRLVAAVSEHRPDMIYERYNLFMLSGVWARSRHKLPLLLEVNAPLRDERARHGGLALRGLARWCERKVWRAADRVLTVTHVLARHIAQEGVSRDTICVTPNAINWHRFKQATDKQTAKRKLGLDGCTVLGFVGFAREWHGLERVLDIVANKPKQHLHCLVVGDGPACEALKRRARELGIGARLTITGIVARDSLPAYLSAFDIALQPSVVSYASPLKLFEYMALRCAIAAPASANLQEVLTDRYNALLFAHDAADGLADATEALLSSTELRRRLGDNARQTLIDRDFTWHANARKVIQQAEALVGSKSVSQPKPPGKEHSKRYMRGV